MHAYIVSIDTVTMLEKKLLKGKFSRKTIITIRVAKSGLRVPTCWLLTEMTKVRFPATCSCPVPSRN